MKQPHPPLFRARHGLGASPGWRRQPKAGPCGGHGRHRHLGGWRGEWSLVSSSDHWWEHVQLRGGVLPDVLYGFMIGHHRCYNCCHRFFGMVWTPLNSGVQIEAASRSAFSEAQLVPEDIQWFGLYVAWCGRGGWYARMRSTKSCQFLLLSVELRERCRFFCLKMFFVLRICHSIWI